MFRQQYLIRNCRVPKQVKKHILLKNRFLPNRQRSTPAITNDLQFTRYPGIWHEKLGQINNLSVLVIVAYQISLINKKIRDNVSESRCFILFPRFSEKYLLTIGGDTVVSQCPNVSIDNIPIPPLNAIKYLGLILDQILEQTFKS